MISEYSDISQVIYEACERLGISNSEAYEMRFLRLVLDAEKKISTGLISAEKTYLYEVGSPLFSDGIHLIIPQDLISGLCIFNSLKEIINPCEYVISGKKIIFKEARTDAIILEYVGIVFDINDQPVISYNHFEAVVSYLVFMETTTRFHSKKATYTEFQDARAWWQDRLGEARGDDAFPTTEDIKASSGALHSVKMYLQYGIVDCGSSSNVVQEYQKIKKVFYGVLNLSDTIVNPEDYTSTILNPETETTVTELSSDSFNLEVTFPGRLTIILPYESGLINSMKDAANNDIFQGYFNIIKDETRQLTIYVANNFITAGIYKLTFGFSN